MRLNIRHILSVTFTGALVALSTLDCGFTATPCKDPNDSWWDCKLTWTSKKTGNVQTAKGWICAPDSNKVPQSTSAMAAATAATDAAIAEGLACAMPESAIDPRIKCIDSHSRLLPQKPLQGEIDIPMEVEKTPERWGDPPCDTCLNDFCKANLFDCAQNQFCSCEHQCLRNSHSFDSDGPCLNTCSSFFGPDPNFDIGLFNALATCSEGHCATLQACGADPSGGGPNDDENLACCANIHCKGE